MLTTRRAWPARMLLSAALGLAGGWSASACASGPAASPAITVTISGAAFAPENVTAHVGDTITWVNKDVVDHTATGRHGEWRVVIEAGKSASLVVKDVGAVDYYCEYHPNMTGHVAVQPKS